VRLKSFFVAALALAFPSTLNALPFALFDKLPLAGQAEFVARLIDETENALRESGNSEAADKIEDLFTKILPGDSMALGLVEYERNESRGRLFDLQRVEKDPNANRIWVEDCLFVTLKKNNILLSDQVTDAIEAKLANFRPQTHAEFAALPVDQQKHFIALMAKFAWPEARFREVIRARIRENKDEKLDLIPDVLNAQFPTGASEQPGFNQFVDFYTAANEKDSKLADTMLQFELFVLSTADAQVVKHMDEMDAGTVMLPDGRHVFRDKNGDLWAVSGHEGSDTRLSGAERELAERLGNCKAAKGIKNGAQALAACRSEVGLPPE
jgi:hypothetical protein